MGDLRYGGIQGMDDYRPSAFDKNLLLLKGKIIILALVVG